MAPAPRAPDRAIWLLSAGLAAAGTVLWQRGLALPSAEPQVWWPLLAVFFAVTERFAVHVPFGRDTHSLTFGQAPLVLGLFLLPADELFVAAITGTFVANALLSRKHPIKVTFNLASTMLQVGLQCVVFVALLDAFGAEAASLSPATWAAAFLAALAGDVYSNLALIGVIFLRGARLSGAETARTLGAAVISTVVVVDFALVTALVAKADPAALGLLAVGAGMSFLLYRGYHVLRQRHSRLEQLYHFTRSVEQALQHGTVAETVRTAAAQLLRAKQAEVVSLATHGPVDSATWWAPAASGELVCLSRKATSPAHLALQQSGHVDGMAAPLRDGGAITGVLTVVDRVDAVSTFDKHDARLFEALAGHAGVVLANDALVERVRAAARETEYLSLHDPLTGLPNRLSFQQHLDRQLTSGRPAAVLLMDIDRFKEINDTLGHDAGDQLLVEIAERMRALESEHSTVARLGGDEFAVLLTGDDVHVEGMVARIGRDFTRSYRVGTITLDVSASLGIATSATDGTSATLLLRRAEVAMYDAKQRRSGVARYSPDRDPYSSRRLTLIADLARALHEGSLEVHYQPQAMPTTAQITGVEALLRWNHPVWGSVPPDEFVALAEHTGLIRQLTRFVLRTSVRQCAVWRDAGTPVLMAVNISARNLHEKELADDVARLLVQADLPASLLKLEVTESALVAEPDLAIDALQRLVDLGLSVSIDDFGTGYSSLTRLRSLPVQEIKIDRTFVRDLARREDDLAIVRAVIRLGHDLGLRVVAEGVEDEASWRILQGLDCDLVQGYFLARPMPPESMTGWLSDRMAEFATRLSATRGDPDGSLDAADPAAALPPPTPRRVQGH